MPGMNDKQFTIQRMFLAVACFAGCVAFWKWFTSFDGWSSAVLFILSAAAATFGISIGVLFGQVRLRLLLALVTVVAVVLVLSYLTANR
jgi:hypothetical protein